MDVCIRNAESLSHFAALFHVLFALSQINGLRGRLFCHSTLFDEVLAQFGVVSLPEYVSYLVVEFGCSSLVLSTFDHPLRFPVLLQSSFCRQGEVCLFVECVHVALRELEEGLLSVAIFVLKHSYQAIDLLFWHATLFQDGPEYSRNLRIAFVFFT